MNKIAQLPQQQRMELFRQTAAQRGMTEQIVEKDFWVCWVLKQLFDSPLKDRIIFKGGTSLSKVYGLIERFSEDIDLILNWTGNPLGNPMAEMSKNKRKKFNDELLAWGNKCIRDEIYPIVREFCGDICTAVLEMGNTGDAIIAIQYPQAFASDSYLRPEIRLEIGALAAWDPHQTAIIKSYAAEQYPHIFSEPEVSVQVTSAARTFWEKATILHTEAGRPESGAFRSRYSRHYYDMVMLARDPAVKAEAFADLPLLDRVVDFKQRFYSGSKWLAYDQAKPGTFRLLPPEYFITDLRSDYANMRNMIYGEYPPFEQLMSELKSLLLEINTIGR